MANDFTGPGDFTGSGIDAPGSLAPGSTANDQFEKTAAWIAPDVNASPGCGRIMLTRPGGAADEPDPVVAVPAGFSFLKKMFGVLAPDSPNVAGNIAIKSKSAANDNVVWVGDEDEAGDGGVYGSDVDAATLADGSSVVAWIGPDRVVHAKYYPAEGDGNGASAEEAAARAEYVGQLNELLSDLGGAGQRAGNADGRVKVTSYGQGGVAALWIADFGFTAALMGKLYMLQQDPAEDSTTGSPAAQTALWTVKDIAPVAVPKFASNISIDVSNDGQISVSYQSEPGDGGLKLAVSVDSGAASEDELRGSDEGDLLAPDAESSDLQVPHGSSVPVKVGNADTFQTNEAEAAAADGEIDAPADQGPARDDDSNGGSFGSIVPDVTSDVELIGTPVTIAGGEGDTVAQKKPQVVAQGDKIAVLHVSDGEKPGTSIIQVDLIDANGNPVIGSDGAPASVVVASDAIVEIPDKPFLELGPSISFAGDKVVVAYVSNSGDAEHTQYQINLQLIDDDGKLASDAPTVVALASDSETTYSDFDTAGLTTHHTTHHHENGDGSEYPDGGGSEQVGSDDDAGSSVTEPIHSEPLDTQGAQVAVVWVENANESGYGSIMGQLFAIVDRESDGQDGSESGDNSGPGNAGDYGQVLVALGLDGSAGSSGGDGDAAFQLPSETAQEVIGRAPQVSGCGDDGIAVVWVQESNPGSGIEVVAGTVLQTSGGISLLAINLTGLISNGILRGTEPSLLSNDNGDIVIGWVQSSSSGLYEAAVAVYRAIETGGWSVPDVAIVLRTFDSEPRNLDFGLQGGDDPTILLSWSSSGSRVSGARFDLDGIQEGSVFRIRGDDNDNAAEGDVSVAGLSDGHIVVVYTQADGADTDIGAMIVQTAPSSASDGSGDGGNSGLGTGSGDLNSDGGPSQIAIVVTTPTADNTDAGTMTNLVVVDLESDLIWVFDAGQFETSGATSSTSGSSSNSGSGSENSGSGSGGDGGSLNYAVNNDSAFDISGSGSAGSGSSGSGSGKVEGDNLAFAVGYGNDAADYYEDEHVFDVTAPIADMFDALQFANALHDNGNGEVLVFEASNLVVIRDFETL